MIMTTNSLAPSVSTLDQKGLEQAFKEIQSLAGVLTNKEQGYVVTSKRPNYIAYNFKRH
jgi:hypothetical protein